MEFDLKRYLGKWYEIAKIRNEFEPGLSNTVAQYTLNPNGTIQVINSGYLGDKFKQITGIARVTDNSRVLDVSFFPGIYSRYKILAIGENYEYALVGGDTDRYLWILSRKPNLEESILEELLRIAREKGYKVEDLIRTRQ